MFAGDLAAGMVLKKMERRINLGSGLAVLRRDCRAVHGNGQRLRQIMMITWLQQKVAPELTGRIMSLVMFAAVGLNPVSNALAGMLIGLNITVLLVCAGLLMTLFTLSAAFSPAVRAGME